MGQKKSKPVLLGEIAQGPVEQDFEGLPENLNVIEFNEIRLMKILGEGGAGPVNYLANYESLGKKCVFKVQRWRSMAGGVNKFRFPEEEVIALEHEMLVELYGVSIKPPRIGLCYEYVEGYDIREFCIRFPDTPYAIRLQFVFELSNILKFLEDAVPHFLKSIVLKESRIFVEDLLKGKSKKEHSDGDSLKYRIRLKHLEMDISDSGGIYDLNIIPFRPPEAKLTGEAKLTSKAAVYQFGILFYMVMTNNWKPYRDLLSEHSESEVFEWIQSKFLRPKMDETVTHEITNGEEKNLWIIDLLRSCWHGNPEERPTFFRIWKGFGRNGFDSETTLAEKDERERIAFLWEIHEEEFKDNVVEIKLGDEKSIKLLMNKFV